MGYPCEIKCKKLSETTIAFSNVKLLPRPTRHEDIQSAWVHPEPWRMHAGAPRHCRKNAGELPRTAPASDLPHRHAMANAECHTRGADRQAQSRGGSHSTYPSVGGGARSIASSSCEHRCCESCDSRARCDDRSAAPSTGRSPSCVQSRSRSPAPSRARPCSETHGAGMDPRHAPSVGRVLSSTRPSRSMRATGGSSGDMGRPHAGRRSHRS